MKDELFDLAVKAVRDAGKCTTSLLQRSLKVGYARAAALIDEMEREGIVSAANGTAPREVLTITESEETPPEKRTSPTMEYLPVRFTPAERLDIAEQLARSSQARGDLEDQKKARDAEYKDELEGLNLSIKRLTRKLTQGNEMRNVSCKWLLEDPTHGEKTLVRLDTGEVVKTVPMQDHDYQEELPMAATSSEKGQEPLVLEPPPSPGPQPGNGAGASH